MRKKILTIVALSLSMSLFSQSSDAFFSYGNVEETQQRDGTALAIQTTTGFGINEMTTKADVPLGSGLLLLTSVGIGYALLKKKEETK